MSQRPPTQPPGWNGSQQPSWMGVPGYTPYRQLPPHAPMPGAPPYPPATRHPPPPLGRPREHTGYPKALGAAAGWAALNLVLTLVLAGPPPSPAALGGLVGALLVATVLAALAVWVIARRRTMSFLALAVVALPFFLVVRLVGNLIGSVGAS